MGGGGNCTPSIVMVGFIMMNIPASMAAQRGEPPEHISIMAVATVPSNHVYESAMVV